LFWRSRLPRTRIGEETGRIWISSVAGGAPIRLTNEEAPEFTGSWSPDGAWFVYCGVRDGKIDLKKVKTTGQATPIVLLRDVADANCPRGLLTAAGIAVGSSLVSPDRQTVKSLGDRRGRHHMFSADGKSVYGIRSDQGREDLFRIDIATGAETVIGDIGRDFPAWEQPVADDPVQPGARRQELHLRQRDVHEQPLDAGRIRGEARPAVAVRSMTGPERPRSTGHSANVLRPIVAIQSVIPILRRHSGGSIVNVNAGTAFMTIPQYSAVNESQASPRPATIYRLPAAIAAEPRGRRRRKRRRRDRRC
jgi:hypothetical protein